LYTAPRGTVDILPEEQPFWRYIEQKIARITRLYGYERIDPPVFEDTRLFIKGTGETTDIVQKEMYTFEDKSGNSITLKPEGSTNPLSSAMNVPRPGATGSTISSERRPSGKRMLRWMPKSLTWPGSS
jgi:histidyl-tRNA synthetase